MKSSKIEDFQYVQGNHSYQQFYFNKKGLKKLENSPQEKEDFYDIVNNKF